MVTSLEGSKMKVVANAKDTRLFFANFTVYFLLVIVFTDHVPIYR